MQNGTTAERTDGSGTPWDTTIVTQVKNGMVHLWRPYGTTADFSYTGGVIPYVGIESYKIEQDSPEMWVLHNRQTLR